MVMKINKITTSLQGISNSKHFTKALLVNSSALLYGDESQPVAPVTTAVLRTVSRYEFDAQKYRKERITVKHNVRANRIV